LQGCSITAHDTQTGEEVWQQRLIPDWSEAEENSWVELRQATERYGAWGTGPSYDPDLDMVYVDARTWSPNPNRSDGSSTRSWGYRRGTIAVNGENGEIVWHYAHPEGDARVGGKSAPLLIEAAVGPRQLGTAWISPATERGRIHRMVTGKTDTGGLSYMLDRETGELLWTRDAGTWMATGRTGTERANRGRPETVGLGAFEDEECGGGAVRTEYVEAEAYNPETETLYMAVENGCRVADRPVYGSLRPGDWLDRGTHVGMGSIAAISVETGEIRWAAPQAGTPSGLLSTSAGLVFVGDASGRIQALDDATGEMLWDAKVGSAITGPPISYAVDHRQYVAVRTTGRADPNAERGERAGEGYNLMVFATDQPPDDEFNKRAAVHGCLADWQEALLDEDYAAYSRYLDAEAREMPAYGSEEAMRFWAHQVRQVKERGFEGKFRLARINVGSYRAPVGAYRAYPVLNDGRELEESVVVAHENGQCRILQVFS
ncbi:MAG: PQQ-binding-like beta-propeller repeat protein, partial [Rhodospirillaceae bacterium]|nr:PQQ-binding-like beta-propeller repeat protein [Rhodospirillaceae bacterium]